MGAEPKRSTDNQLYAPLVQDPDFEIGYDAWRGSKWADEDYSSIYLWIYRSATSADRALSGLASDPDFSDMADGIQTVDNVLWTTDLGDPTPDQQDLFDGCITRARG
ncbi:MAG: hypothetical protein NT122_08970 [Solirubrobacterales bacterium]|nr:hypothetical protein [Solirubrobacterales bacterium]